MFRDILYPAISDSLSNYNSLQTTLKIRNWRGVTLTGNYTWAHPIDAESDVLDFVPNASQPNNSWNPNAECATSDFDIRQRMQWYWTYSLSRTEQAKWILNR
jgi:hypothetical protein